MLMLIPQGGTEEMVYRDLNTSHVNVNLIVLECIEFIIVHLNTSHVNVNPYSFNVLGVNCNIFKYISC